MISADQFLLNKNAKIVIWISLACYLSTAVLPIVSIGFIIYYQAMIYEVLSPLGLACFFSSIVSVFIAILTFSNHISFRFFAILATILSILPIIVLIDWASYFVDLNVGFYTYLGGVITSLVAGIIYKNPKSSKRPLVRTILDTQDKQADIATDEKVMFLEYPEKNVQTLSFQDQNVVENAQSTDGTWFCGNCGQSINKTASFCEHCGFDLSEQ